ncbi:hypothetical protein BJP40_00690 [Streptomyces sp. CC53]|uniref:DUF3168 domain-containing protein n=1 Tax=Streptomyces sp. CC53 TaxID=1906740 RepID=UPI0008DD5786|nr:DUF3168 domain-containing protein [Streptomyces sp. CC53]OII60112.1 hypothetical protein BJP40_00690 [Streptomyces sp. CC53]
MSTPTPGLALLPVQIAVYGALQADAALGTLVTGVFDFVEEGQPYPYVHVGEAIETPDNAHDRHGAETVITLHVWSQYRGYAEALRIAGRVVEVLDHTPLSIDGHHHVATRFEFSQTLTDPEPPGDIRHVVLRFRIVTDVTGA